MIHSHLSMQTAVAGQRSANCELVWSIIGALSRATTSYPFFRKNSPAVVVSNHRLETPLARACSSIRETKLPARPMSQALRATTSDRSSASWPNRSNPMLPTSAPSSLSATRKLSSRDAWTSEAANWLFVSKVLMTSRSSLKAARICIVYAVAEIVRSQALAIARRPARTATKKAIADSIETKNTVHSTAT
ncbi:hypothetical protein SAMN05216466_10517 [Paraburkholderia phenazinium]|uniref:Uncharacterized protein n=1 Tax=Paraburkholderia phenazinium TaxID=60549 RepID=A0A1G7WRJ7_9BURK|nr:hypothetical protein SAMN05216466_10517 [Paraburkholderia phenazinium]